MHNKRILCSRNVGDLVDFLFVCTKHAFGFNPRDRGPNDQKVLELSPGQNDDCINTPILSPEEGAT